MAVAGVGRTVYNGNRTQGGGQMILAFCIDNQGGLAFNHRRPCRYHSLSEIQLINTPNGAVAADWGVFLIDSTI